jgi:hypothetical protein
VVNTNLKVQQGTFKDFVTNTLLTFMAHHENQHQESDVIE